MRSIWVHASYMEALNTGLLSSALELQDELLGVTKNFRPARARDAAADTLSPPHDSLSLTQRDGFHVANGLTNQSWFFHSPLLYWSCSRDRILNDEDILSTINDKKNQSTSANVTLRHSIVFSGKRFEDRRLLAADALVVTLLHLRDSPVGREWEQRALALPQKAGDRWDMYPPDGHATSSQLYEFQFRPMSAQDMTSLAVAYGLTLVYFLMSLSKLRAVKSKFGLMVTIATQLIFSTMSSFTVCAIFNIDLSRIPRVSYPLVTLAMSLEHIFRLINAVILTPFEDSVSNRIGQAFGATAVVALASTLQNVLLLAILSRIVSQGVSEFCVFAAVAIVFDFFYLSTFFLSVLSVDVRRMELGDALAKASMRHNRSRADTRGRRSWWDQALQGKIAMSTRIAGTIVMFGFVLIAQWHFFGDETLFRKLLRLCGRADPIRALDQPDKALLENIHQARSPMSWLRMQDHETAQEVINIIKPSAHSYIARVYEPLVFVQKNSDRVPHSKEPALLPAAYDFVHNELARFIVIFIVVIAALRLLTNFLLWEDEASTEAEHDSDDVPLLSVKSLARGHRMDVVLMTSSADGHVVSVDLDRTIRVWSIRGLGMSYAIAKTGEAAANLYPVVAMSIDDKSRWLAILSRPRRTGESTVSFWNLSDRVWGPSVPAASCGQRPAAFFFDPAAPHDNPRVLIVHQDGGLTEVSAAAPSASEAMILFPQQLTCARLVARKGAPKPPTTTILLKAMTDRTIMADSSAPTPQPVILTVARQGDVHMASRKEAAWQSRRLAIEGIRESGANNIEALSSLELFLVAATDCVHLVSADEGLVLQTLHTGKMLPRPLKCAYSCHRLSQPGSTGLTSFTVGYVEADSRDCILRTFVPPDDCDAIYLQTPPDARSSDWCTWSLAKETSKRIADPGVWEVVSDGSAVGVRHKQPADKSSRANPSLGLRNRYSKRGPEPDPFESWQVWTASPGGRPEADECRRLIKDGEQANHLLITELGPQGQGRLKCRRLCFWRHDQARDCRRGDTARGCSRRRDSGVVDEHWQQAAQARCCG